MGDELATPPPLHAVGTKLCECGCGQPTKIAKKNYPKKGHVKGQLLRFVTGHHLRTPSVSSVPFPDCQHKSKRNHRVCPACQRRRLREESPEFSKRMRERFRQWKYDISPAQYQYMLDQQRGVCAICAQPPDARGPLNVDHNHNTGVIRGLLCIPCNRGIGFLRDSSSLILTAHYYVTSSGVMHTSI